MRQPYVAMLFSPNGRGVALVKDALTLALRDPTRLAKVASAQLRYLVAPPASPTRKKIGDVVLTLDLATDTAVKLMYYNLYEPDTVCALRRYLRPGDGFIDVGANIGYFSALAASLVGTRGIVQAFEPVPTFFQRLQQLAASNPSFQIRPYATALGSSAGVSLMSVTKLPNIGWNTLVPGFMPQATVRYQIPVPVARLDGHLREHSLPRLKLIKIDTEGYEFPILRGLSGYLSYTKHRPLILCEVAPAAYGLLGVSLAQLADYMERWGYRSLALRDGRPVQLAALRVTTNVLFMPA